MNPNYPAASLAYFRNKLLFLYTTLQLISKGKLANVGASKTNQFFTSKLSFSSLHIIENFIETDVFKSHPVVFMPNLFYTISGSAIFSNLSIIMRQRLAKPIIVYAHKQTANNANFLN